MDEETTKKYDEYEKIYNEKLEEVYTSIYGEINEKFKEINYLILNGLKMYSDLTYLHGSGINIYHWWISRCYDICQDNKYYDIYLFTYWNIFNMFLNTRSKYADFPESDGVYDGRKKAYLTLINRIIPPPCVDWRTTSFINAKKNLGHHLNFIPDIDGELNLQILISDNAFSPRIKYIVRELYFDSEPSFLPRLSAGIIEKPEDITFTLFYENMMTYIIKNCSLFCDVSNLTYIRSLYNPDIIYG